MALSHPSPSWNCEGDPGTMPLLFFLERPFTRADAGKPLRTTLLGQILSGQVAAGGLAPDARVRGGRLCNGVSLASWPRPD